MFKCPVSYLSSVRFALHTVVHLAKTLVFCWLTVDLLNVHVWHPDYEDQPLDKPLKLVLKVGGSEVTELSGSGHDSSYYDDRSDHERERHKEKKKKKKKKSEKEKDKHVDDEERRRRKVSKGGGSSLFITALPRVHFLSGLAREDARTKRWRNEMRCCFDFPFLRRRRRKNGRGSS